ncbi:YcaO-like family protein [Clostridium oceanicum]|uniref:YcaO domain-containing protein n=1 Tax=Clostridium oceanicum TaxID=1543 RepID=A0ABN1JKC8_9CLOT
MNSLVKNNYKDKDPISTICKIRTILNENGILPIESNWNDSVDSYHSIHLTVPDTNICCNGKGINPKFALASAYGEFMERFQNQMFYRHIVGFSEEVTDYRDFFFAPDEIYCSIEDVLKENYKDLPIYIPPVFKSFLNYDLVKKWTNFSPEKFSSKVLCIPFYDSQKKSINYVPLAALEIYGSNGMCGGNTPEEAMVEGICEIFERYSKIKVLDGEINPPTIDREYIKKFPRQYKMIEDFENFSDYEIIVKDCSLNKDFPVIGVIVVNKKEQKYFWSFGSHPTFEIALERTLTEILQGKSIFEFDKLMDYSYKKEINDSNNTIQALKDGKAYYLSKVFTPYESYPFSEFKDIKDKSNKGMLNHILDILKKEGFNVLVRDVSITGFDSFHIIVPGMSEIPNTELEIYLDQRIEGVKIAKQVRNLNSLSSEDLKKIIAYIKKYEDFQEDNIVNLTLLPMKYTFPWHDIDTELFISCAYYKIGDLKNSFKYIERYAHKLKSSKDPDFSTLSWYKCIRDYIGASIDKLEPIKIKESLQMFYDENLLQDVEKTLENPQNIFENYGKLNCFDCANCEFKESCYYKNVANIHMKFKDLYYENQIDQSRNKKYF